MSVPHHYRVRNAPDGWVSLLPL